ncbi:MAG TPA: DUF3761 domain-containing protein [Kofleriaceae bacterium]
MRRALLVCIVAGFAAPHPVAAQTVTCADGTTSEAGRGACSHHGGVAKTRAPREASDAKATRTTRTTRSVRCNDGTRSTSTGRGTCSGHGGIADDGPIQIDRDKSQPRTRTNRGVQCSDGTWSTSTGRGTCSGHGGIADGPIAVDRDEPQARKRTETRTRNDRPWWGSDEPLPGEPLARCMDGTLSYSKHHRGTCSSHGGVRDWLDD